MLQLDHIVIAAQTLDEGRAFAEAALGVPLQLGGAHRQFGTHNALLGLEDGLYLEVIARDPAATLTGPSWFGLDHFAGPPRLTNWVCQSNDLDAAVAAEPALGAVVEMTRNDLRWRITVPKDGGLPYDGGYPTLLTWAVPDRHPAKRLIPMGCRLTRWEVLHPQADILRAHVPLADDRVVFTTAPTPAFRAVIDTPAGPRTLS